MIARTDGNEIGLFGMSCRILVLHRHFQRHLDRHRTAIGIKDMPHRGRSYPQQPFAQSYGWLVRQSAEHHVRHIFQLVFYRPIQFGTIVTMQFNIHSLLLLSVLHLLSLSTPVW